MNSIPIFDSLTHPMPSGGWLKPEYEGKNSISGLLHEMEVNNIQWALAVGMGENIGSYNENEYAAFIADHSNSLFPVAFLDFQVLESGTSISSYLSKLKRLGYVGIKIHPRFSRITFANKYLPGLIKEANQVGLLVLICTYFWSNEKELTSNSPALLQRLLCEVPDEKLLLLHGGAVKLLEVTEMVRQFPNILLDLSFTLSKYQGSSIDMDIQYLFNNFDRRICVGSDSPEMGLSTLRQRFENFAKGIENTKAQNIGFRNLQKHMGLNL